MRRSWFERLMYGSWFERLGNFVFETNRQPIFFGFAGVLAVICLSSFIRFFAITAPQTHTIFDLVKLVGGLMLILYVWAGLTESLHKSLGLTDAKEEAKMTERQLAAEESQAKDNRLNKMELDLDAYYEGRVVYRPQ